LPAAVGDDEPLASYVLESNKFKQDGIDHRQLMPSNKYGNASVFRTKGLGFAEAAAIGHKEVAVPRQKPGILGWAEVFAKVVRAALPLTVDRDEPPERHALIQGWPQQREQQRTLALLLATKATVVKHSTVPQL
jgi:hypothetical protein